MPKTTKNAEENYEPKFPEAHALLMEIYKNLMTARKKKDIFVWNERFKALQAGWESLSDDGVLPVLFIKQFGEDVRNVAKVVNHGIKTTNLTEKQGLATFGLMNLQLKFGGRK